MAALLPDGVATVAFYATAFAACLLNAAAIAAVIKGWVRSTPTFHTAVMLASWLLYQIAFRFFTDHPQLPPWPACGFCPRSLSFDPGENARICTGFIGSFERWMVLSWEFPWTGGNGMLGVIGAAAVGGRRAPTMGAGHAAFVWWPTFAGCVLGFAIGEFADVIRWIMRRMQKCRRRRLRRRAYRRVNGVIRV